jgi:hypothetical protein
MILGLAALTSALRVFYIPLDERFTTRFAFLNVARITPFNVITPPMDMISSYRQPANETAMDAFTAQYLPQSDAAVISMELFAYGGLINSRCSNDSTDAIEARCGGMFERLWWPSNG